MGKKKIIGLCLAVGLMVGVVGGSLAWFTDNDSVTNSFATQGNGQGQSNGIKIEEDFDKITAGSMLPGTTVTKAVQVENKATYDQYIRVKLTKVWKDKDGNVIDKVGETTLNDEFIELNFGKNLGVEANKWTYKDGYYYYNSIVEKADATDKSGPDITSKLLESVTLSKEATSIYKNIKFDVVVDAEGIQAANGAAQDAWGYTPGATK
ncbi:BsaA family SipW-dependent biofilm matrix protein [Clostridium baratii]|uniref:BsaA family SipW-dependent biofilm matrix protein n=1 Tax=Clostridium baratii TaxID=1561 RepID=UPI0030CEBBA2